MFETNPFAPGSRLYTVYETLKARTPAPPLTPARPFDSEIQAYLNALPEGERPAPLALACLHLLNDDLEAAHVLCQAQEGDPTADYIHCIVHRREGDFGNARYWARRAGTHPFHSTLWETVREPFAPILTGWTTWDNERMVMLSERLTRSAGDTDAARRLGAAESRGLLLWVSRTS